MRADRGFLRLLVTAFALFAFTAQGYLTQTHIHWLVRGPAGTVQVSDTAPGTAKTTKTPAKLPGEDSNCPICHQIAQSGQFLTPAAAAALPPVLSVAIITVAAALPSEAAPISHAWQGRAPPLA